MNVSSFENFDQTLKDACGKYASVGLVPHPEGALKDGIYPLVLAQDGQDTGFRPNLHETSFGLDLARAGIPHTGRKTEAVLKDVYNYITRVEITLEPQFACDWEFYFKAEYGNPLYAVAIMAVTHLSLLRAEQPHRFGRPPDLREVNDTVNAMQAEMSGSVRLIQADEKQPGIVLPKEIHASWGQLLNLLVPQSSPERTLITTLGRVQLQRISLGQKEAALRDCRMQDFVSLQHSLTKIFKIPWYWCAVRIAKMHMLYERYHLNKVAHEMGCA